MLVKATSSDTANGQIYKLTQQHRQARHRQQGRRAVLANDRGGRVHRDEG
jgi:hypothetical protein